MTNKYDTENNRDRNDADTDRYAAYSDSDGETIIFDTRNAEAWLKSDAALDLEEMD